MVESTDTDAALDAVARADATFASNAIVRLVTEMRDGVFDPRNLAFSLEQMARALYRSDEPNAQRALDVRAADLANRFKGLSGANLHG